jgi:hypothetical protein
MFDKTSQSWRNFTKFCNLDTIIQYWKNWQNQPNFVILTKFQNFSQNNMFDKVWQFDNFSKILWIKNFYHFHKIAIIVYEIVHNFFKIEWYQWILNDYISFQTNCTHFQNKILLFNINLVQMRQIDIFENTLSS